MAIWRGAGRQHPRKQLSQRTVPSLEGCEIFARLRFARTVRYHRAHEADRWIGTSGFTACCKQRQRQRSGTQTGAIRRQDGVIAGHGRLAAARQLDLAEVPVIMLKELSATQRRQLMLADNRIAQNAGWDAAMLNLELAELSFLAADLFMRNSRLQAARLTAAILFAGDGHEHGGGRHMGRGGRGPPSGGCLRITSPNMAISEQNNH
jgi:hypothetical protein